MRFYILVCYWFFRKISKSRMHGLTTAKHGLRRKVLRKKVRFWFQINRDIDRCRWQNLRKVKDSMVNFPRFFYEFFKNLKIPDFCSYLLLQNKRTFSVKLTKICDISVWNNLMWQEWTRQISCPVSRRSRVILKIFSTRWSYHFRTVSRQSNFRLQYMCFYI